MRRFVVAPDAGARLAVAAEWLTMLPADAEVLILSPSWEACDDLVRGVLGPQGARFGIVRLTLERLAHRLAVTALSRLGRAPTTQLGHVAVVARAVQELRTANRFRYFAPVADRPGFPPAAARTLEELAMHGVAPAALERLSHGGVDLAVLAAAVEDELARAGLAARSHVYDTALAAARAPAAPHPVGLPLLLLDLPLTSPLEARLVAALARPGVAVLATAPAGDERATARLARALECQPERLACVAAGSLAMLQQHLFESTSPPRAERDDSVRLRAWPGEARECVEIARAIQAEAAAGVAFDRMAVLLHAPADYAPHLEEALGRAAIPFFFAHGAKRPHPAGRALLTLLACAAEGLSARRFAEYLSLSQVPDPNGAVDPAAAVVVPQGEVLPEPAPSPPDDELLLRNPDDAAVVAGTLRAPRHWEQLLVDAAVIGGRERWERRLDGFGRELLRRRQALEDGDETRRGWLDRQLADLGHLRAFALPLIDQLAQLPTTAAWGEWLVRLRQLATAALREPLPVLAALAELEPMAPVGPVDLDEVRLVLGPRLRDATLPPPRRRYGAVFVAPTTAARALVFDVVFVPGLAENVFPARVVEDPVLLDVQRNALDAGLPTEADRAAGERLALRLAAGAARRRVYLSYPRVDVEKSRPRVPSFYALDVLQAAEGELPGFNTLAQQAEREASARLGWPAPERPDDAIDEAEYDLALLAPLLGADEQTVLGTAHYLLQANPHLARALRARGRRWLKRWTPNDGLVDPDDLARAALAHHQIDARSFSPTALQHFAACPYRFFLHAIHRLQPREEPVAVEVIDPLTRGSLFHDVQFGVLMRLRDENRLPLSPGDLEAAWGVLDTVLGEQEAKRREELRPAIPRVWQDGIEAIRADLREWLRRQACEPDGWVPVRFELAFGLPASDREFADPASVREPVQVLDGLSLRGSIDLVERHVHGMVRATDHKTGKAWAAAGVVTGGGSILQPLLYALACERLLGGTVDAGRLYYCTDVGGWSERVVPLDARSRDTIRDVVAVIADALRQGFLPAAPSAGACRFCDYQIVCGPYEEVRTGRKPQERLASLQHLRSLP